MGWIIKPDGISVECHLVTGSVHYETIVSDLQCEWYTADYRLKCVKVIDAVGIFKRYRESVTKTLKNLSSDADSLELREAVVDLLKRRKAPKARNHIYENLGFSD